MPKFVSVKDRLPPSCSLKDECNPYYIVKVKGYGNQKAMYCGGKWYSSYIERIIAKVTHWLDESDENGH